MTEEPGKFHVPIENAQGIHIGDRYGLQVTKKHALIFVLSVSVVAVVIPLTIYFLPRDTSTHASQPGPALPQIVASAGSSPVPAPKNSPPVIVTGVTQMRSNSADGSFALPKPLHMSDAELATFNKTIGMSTSVFSPWYAEHEGTAVDFGTTTFTVRGNAKESVRIVDLRVLKDCAAPLDGTFFRGYSQGSGNTLRIGFDLDAPDPVARQLGFSSSKGLFVTEDHYFDIKTVTLAPGEQETFTVGALTKLHSCTFSLRMFVATASGTFYQDIDQNGQPFRVTAKAAPANRNAPLSGYRSAYAYLLPDRVHGSWQEVKPATFK